MDIALESRRERLSSRIAAATAQGWLESPAWDFFWMLSGLWLLLVIFIAQALGHTPLIPDLLAYSAILLLWGGHILAPMIVSWTNADLRRHMVDRKGKYVWLPAGVALGALTLGILGDLSRWTTAPAWVTEHLNPRFLLFYIFMVWNTWHFSAQHFGVLAIYRSVAGRPSRPWRGLDRTFCVGMTCVLLPIAWYTQVEEKRLGPLFQYLPHPSTVPDLSSILIGVSFLLTLTYIGYECVQHCFSLPRVLYLLSIGIQPIFGAISYPLYHMAIFSICHWMVEFGLASRILQNQSRGSLPRLARWIPQRATFMRYVVALGLLSVPMGIVFLSPPFHEFLAGLHHATYDRARFLAYSLGTLPLSLGVLSGAYFGITFVHYIYDRYLYAFSRPEVRSAVAPHMFRSIKP